jgi:tetratricopeptide (TPR) repeat protein
MLRQRFMRTEETVEGSRASVLEASDRLYRKRRDPVAVRQSLELLWENAESDYEFAWRLGRAHFFLGQESISSKEKRSQYKAGIKASQRAARMVSTRPEGHFWLGVNFALLAETGRTPSAIVQAWRARRALLKAAALDPAYHDAGPLRVLGRLEHKLPTILGGSMERSRLYFQEAAKLAPQNTVSRIYFAEMLINAGDLLSALQQLESAMNCSVETEWVYEAERDRRLAVELKLEIQRRLKVHSDES